MTFLTAINFLLNLAGLVLWLKWRSFRFDPLVRTRPATLTGTLRRAEPARLKRWHFLAALAALLLLRSWFYWQVGEEVDWVPSLTLDPISVSFRSDFFWRMLLFSSVSFLTTLGIAYLWLLLLSLINAKAGDGDPCQSWVRLHLGRIERWPWPLKLLLPFVLTLLFWMGLSPLLEAMKMIPPVHSTSHRLQQAAVMGFGAFLPWKYLIGTFLLLGLLNSYVYLGDQPVWAFVGLTSRNLTIPLRPLPLRVGKVDFAPLACLVVVFVAAEFADRALIFLFSRLPL